MAKQREGMNLRLPPELKDQVRELARDNKRTLTREIELALERHVGVKPRG